MRCSQRNNGIYVYYKQYTKKDNKNKDSEEDNVGNSE